MTDTEQIYALYVQANPVPDPYALPPTHVETELLTQERSTDMDTRERIGARPSPTAPRRRGLAFGLAAIVAVAAVAVGAFLIAGGGDSPVAAADAQPEVVFDGTSCRYDGPTLIEEGSIEITTINTSAIEITVGGFGLAESQLAAELAAMPLGTDKALTVTDPIPDGEFWATQPVPAGSEVTNSKYLGAGGTHIIDCLYYANPLDPSPNHAWRAATTFEVVAP